MFELTLDMLEGLPQTGLTDPIEYYRRPLIGWLYLERINRGLRLLPQQRFGRALEVGYGAGALLMAMKDGVEELHGIDLDADPIPLTEFFHSRNCRPDLRQGSVYALPYEQDFFDLVLSFSVFEHLREYRRALGEVYRVLRPGGLFLLGMPSVNKLMEAGFFAIRFKGINDLHITRPADVARCFQAIGFRELKKGALDFPAPRPLGIRLYRIWLLEKPESSR